MIFCGTQWKRETRQALAQMHIVVVIITIAAHIGPAGVQVRDVLTQYLSHGSNIYKPAHTRNAKTHKDTRGGHSRGGATCPASTTDPDAASHCRCFSPGNCVGGDDERCRGPYRKLHCTAAPSPPET